MEHQPPKWAIGFFQRVCRGFYLEGIEGDLFELFEQRVEEKGPFKAKMLYLWDMITLMRASIIKINLFNSNTMAMDNIFNYVKITFRTGLRNKFFTFIHILGLTLGISSLLFIVNYLNQELIYDQHITNVEKKFRLYDKVNSDMGEESYSPMVPPPFTPFIKENFPQVKKIGRLFADYGGTLFKIEEKIFSEKNGFFAEKEGLEILDIEVLKGSMDGLNEPNTFLLSESLFKKFFGNAEYNNQVVDIEGTSFAIVGIYEDIPEQSHLTPDYFISFEYLLQHNPERLTNSWLWHQSFTYIELEENSNSESIEALIQESIYNRAKPDLEEHGISYKTYFQPVTDIHLHSEIFSNDMADTNSYQNIIFLSIAALVILLVACLNFINLTSAQTVKRAKEVAVRKFVGALKREIFTQHCVEALVYVFISGLISLLIFIFLLPEFNQFTQKNIQLPEVLTPVNVLIYIAFLSSLGLIAGFYPALLLTKIRAIRIIKGLSAQRIRFKKYKWNIDLRQVLVCVQYALSIGLIILSLVVYEQYQYMQKADLGFNKERLVIVQTNNAMRRDLEATREAFMGHSNVENITFSYGVPGGIVAGDAVIIPQINSKKQSSNVFVVDHNFLETMEFNLITGRDFSTEHATDHAEAFILNKEALSTFGLGSPEEAIGTSIHWPHWNFPDSIKKGEVIGVIDDFSVKSMHEAIPPIVIHLNDGFMRTMLVRLGKGDLKTTINHLEEQYQTFAGDRPFEFEFLDQTFNEFYLKEQRMSQLFGLFTLFAIITSLIGLLGLVNHTVQYRGKELSIRKILGAGDLSIYYLLVNKYVILIAIALAVAGPFSFYILEKWLDSFAYHISVDFLIIVKVFFLVLLLTLVIVSYHIFKGVRENPASRLRMD